MIFYLLSNYRRKSQLLLRAARTWNANSTNRINARTATNECTKRNPKQNLKMHSMLGRGRLYQIIKLKLKIASDTCPCINTDLIRKISQTNTIIRCKGELHPSFYLTEMHQCIAASPRTNLVLADPRGTWLHSRLGRLATSRPWTKREQRARATKSRLATSRPWTKREQTDIL
jgi:hypothetical protein